MQYAYRYRSSDNVLHDGVIDAKTRDDVYAKLRRVGIRPTKVFDPELRWWQRVSWRWVSIIVLLASLMFTCAQLFVVKDRVSGGRNDFRSPISRRQIWGDRAIIEHARADNWRGVFDDRAERILALFAQPGERVVMPVIPPWVEVEFVASLGREITIGSGELDEYRQIKRIVLGMKQELREYIRDGGTATGYVARLLDRQRDEYVMYEEEKAKVERAVGVVDDEELRRLWQDANQRLRSMGIRTLDYPSVRLSRARTETANFPH